MDKMEILQTEIIQAIRQLESKLDIRFNTIDTRLNNLDLRLSNVENRLVNIENRMTTLENVVRKIERCVDIENLDIEEKLPRRKKAIA